MGLSLSMPRSFSRCFSLSQSLSWSLSLDDVESLREDRDESFCRSLFLGLSRSSRSWSFRRLLDSELLGMLSIGQLGRQTWAEMLAMNRGGELSDGGSDGG